MHHVHMLEYMCISVHIVVMPNFQNQSQSFSLRRRLIKWGIVQTESQATIVLYVVIGVCVVASFLLLSGGDSTGEKYGFYEEVKTFYSHEIQ